jgi:5-methylcytosine-specific restriction endonuclease McrA
MGKHQFTDAERYAVYNVHGEKCYMCGEPIDLLSMKVDHIIPEQLLNEPERLAAILAEYGLPTNFDLNSYANWRPACGPCNNRKRARIFNPTPRIQIELQIASEKAGEAEALAGETVSKQSLTKALNAIKRALSGGAQADNLISELRPFILFHLEHRSPERAAEPIRLAPNYTVFLEIEFFGGCFDKKIIRSGNPELDVNKAKWLLLLVGSYIANSKKEQKTLDSLLRWRQPVPEVVALAKAQGWPKAKYDTQMRYHVYEVTSYEETDNMVRFKAYYQGIE